jgi:hypothetical protein
MTRLLSPGPVYASVATPSASPAAPPHMPGACRRSGARAAAMARAMPAGGDWALRLRHATFRSARFVHPARANFPNCLRCSAAAAPPRWRCRRALSRCNVYGGPEASGAPSRATANPRRTADRVNAWRRAAIGRPATPPGSEDRRHSPPWCKVANCRCNTTRSLVHGRCPLRKHAGMACFFSPFVR